MYGDQWLFYYLGWERNVPKSICQADRLRNHFFFRQHGNFSIRPFRILDSPFNAVQTGEFESGNGPGICPAIGDGYRTTDMPQPIAVMGVHEYVVDRGTTPHISAGKTQTMGVAPAEQKLWLSISTRQGSGSGNFHWNTDRLYSRVCRRILVEATVRESCPCQRPCFFLRLICMLYNIYRYC